MTPTPKYTPGPVEAHLRAMRSLLSGPEKWTQGAFARDESGARVAPDSGKACRWCLVGASDRIGPSPRGWFIPLLEVTGRRTVVEFNDARNRKFPAVAAALDKSIALAQERGV